MFVGSRRLLPVSINFVTLVLKPGRKEGHAVREPSLLRGIAVLRRSSSRKKRRPPVAARWRWCWSNGRAGWDGRLAAVLLGRGGVAAVRESGGAEESAPFASGPEPAAIRQVGGGAGNGGLAAGCPRLEEPSPSARRRRSVKPSTKDVQYHRMAPRVRAAQLVEDRAQCLSGNRTEMFFFFLSSLSLLILPSPFLSPRLSLPPGTPQPP